MSGDKSAKLETEAARGAETHNQKTLVLGAVVGAISAAAIFVFLVFSGVTTGVV